MKSILKHGVQIYEILLKSVQVHEVRSRKIGSTRAAHVRKTRAAVPGICLLRHYVQRARQTNSPPEFCTTWLLHTFATFAHDLSTKISGCILPWPAVSLHGFQHFRKSTQGTDTATKIHVQSSPTDEALEYIHIHVHYCWHSWQRGSWNTLKCFTSTGRWRNGEETISAIRSQGASIKGKPCDSGNVVETSTYWLDLPKCCDYFSDSTMLNHISCCFHVARTCCLHLLPLYFKQFGEDGEILAKPMSMEEMSSWVCPATCDGCLQFLCVSLYCFMALLMHW